MDVNLFKSFTLITKFLNFKIQFGYWIFGHWLLFGACLPAVGRGFGYWDLKFYEADL
jgi:hypothetical protein